MARLTRDTHSCILMGLGPLRKVFRRLRIESRRAGRDCRGSWSRSYVICVTGQTSNCNFDWELLTFPFNVVAANNFTSAVTSVAERIECVVGQASGYNNVKLNY